MKFTPTARRLATALLAAMPLLVPAGVRAACACDPDVSFSTRPEVTLPVAASSQVDVDLGNSISSFIQAAYEQINGTVPSAAVISQQTANFSNPYWRRIDTVNTFLNQANKNLPRVYSDPWVSDNPLTTAPCKNVSRDVGAVCMFFFGCVGGTNCQMDWANTHANGMNVAAGILGYGGSPTGIYNSGVNTGFWYRELMDARYAGLQFLMPNVYGPDLTGNSISNLAAALANIAGQGLSSQVKIALFDDTSGWSGGSPPPFNNVPSFSNPSAAASAIFNDKWKPFFQAIPSAYWYTVNGRPLIYFYNAGTLTPLNQAAATVSQLKSLFNSTFGVTPYVVVDRAYFADPAMQSTADNEFVWDTLHSGLANNLSSYSFNGIRWDHAMVKWDPLGRNYYGQTPPNIHIANSGDGIIKDDSYLVNALNNSGPGGDNANVLVLATWNDLGEGTGINRNYDYYWNGQWQPPDVFMDDIRASQSQQTCGTILPTPVPTPVQTPLVSDFETSNAQNGYTEWNAGSIVTALDSAGSTMTQYPWAYADCAAGNGSAHAARISGTLAAQNIVAGTYPFAYLGLQLTPGGDNPSNANVNVLPESPNQGLQFDFKSGVAGVQYRVDLVEHDGTTKFNYTYFQFVFTAPDTNWHTVDVYFPGVSGGGFRFSRPGGGTFDPTVLGAVLFQVQPQNGATVNYDLTVDNVTFDAPPPPPAIGGPLITDFDSNNAEFANLTEWNNGNIMTAKDSYGTTMTQYPWKWSTGTGAGNPGAAGRISGKLAQQIPSSNQYPFAFMGLELTPNGSIPTNANVNVLPYAPNQGLQFDYKSGLAGVQYRVDLVEHDGVTTFGYNYFQYVWTAPDTAWHTVDVYFPGVVGGAYHFSRPGGGTFDPTQLGAVLFQVQPQNTGTVNYDLSVDNVSFDAPAPPTPTVTPTATPSATASASPTATPSPTGTMSATPSPRPSPSASPSGSPTGSPTGTPSPSPSASGTPSPTSSPSPSPSFTASPAHSPSFSPTRTPSASVTPTPTVSATPTASASVTPSFTASPAYSHTFSPTITLTATPSPSFSASPTATGTATPPPSPSFSPTASPSFTASSTGTPAPSATDSPTPGATASFTPTATATGTFTAAPSPTHTASPAPSLTSTDSATPRPTSTDSPTGTPTPTPVVPTVSLTPSPTASPTASPTSAPPASPQGTSQPGGGYNVIHQAYPGPNPNPRYLYLDLGGQCDQVRCQVFTKSMVCVMDLRMSGSYHQGWNSVAFPAGWDQNLPHGIYYLVIYSSRNGMEVQGPGPLLAYILR